MPKIPFNRRFGTGLPTPPLDKDVPESARIGLINILDKLIRNDYLYSWNLLANEALLVGRKLRQDFDEHTQDQEICTTIIKSFYWDRFYIFCENLYQYVQAPADRDESDAEAKRVYTDHINSLLVEENLAYEFSDGLFHRRGRPQTQKGFQKASAVLADERYSPARKHYNNAVKFFNERPEPDARNCIKEAVCALEAFAEILFGKKAAKSFEEVLRSKKGTGEHEIPPTIVDGIIKIRAFRGDAQGVAHAALEGSSATIIEAELVLSLVASYITYLNDKFALKHDEIPYLANKPPSRAPDAEAVVHLPAAAPRSGLLSPLI